MMGGTGASMLLAVLNRAWICAAVDQRALFFRILSTYRITSLRYCVVFLSIYIPICSSAFCHSHAFVRLTPSRKLVCGHTPDRRGSIPWRIIHGSVNVPNTRHAGSDTREDDACSKIPKSAPMIFPLVHGKTGLKAPHGRTPANVGILSPMG